MESFDLFCVGSIPTFLSFVLGNERVSIPPCSLYHSDPCVRAHFLDFLGRGGYLRSRLVCWYVRGIVLASMEGSFSIVSVLVGHSGIEGMRPGFIGSRRREVELLWRG